MNQRELCERTASVLRASGHTKQVPQAKKLFTITDMDGNSRQFQLSEPPKEVTFNEKDIRLMLQALSEVVRATVRTGEQVRIAGLFTVFPHYHQECVYKDILTGQLRVRKGRYNPKFRAHTPLKDACRQYANYLQEQNLDAQSILSTDYEEPYYDDYEEYYGHYPDEGESEDEILLEEINDDEDEDDSLDDDGYDDYEDEGLDDGEAESDSSGLVIEFGDDDGGSFEITMSDQGEDTSVGIITEDVNGQ